MANRRSASSGVFWEVVAPIARWPLTSPRRLLLVIVGTVLFLLAVSYIRDHTAATATTTGQGAAAVVATDAPSPVAASTAPTSSGAASAAANSAPDIARTDPQVVALEFARRWARPDLGQPTWSDSLTPLATAEYASKLATVLPANVPAHAALSAQAAVPSPNGRTVDVTTDSGVVTVNLVSAGSAWQVASLDLKSQNGSGSAGATIAPTYTTTGTR